MPLEPLLARCFKRRAYRLNDRDTQPKPKRRTIGCNGAGLARFHKWTVNTPGPLNRAVRTHFVVSDSVMNAFTNGRTDALESWIGDRFHERGTMRQLGLTFVLNPHINWYQNTDQFRT